jgi:hypothetical protein
VRSRHELILFLERSSVSIVWTNRCTQDGRSIDRSMQGLQLNQLDTHRHACHTNGREEKSGKEEEEEWRDTYTQERGMKYIDDVMQASQPRISVEADVQSRGRAHIGRRERTECGRTWPGEAATRVDGLDGPTGVWGCG